MKRPQPHSSLQDQVDWSLPIKWTPRSTGPSTHIRNLALPLSREASATLALPPLSPTTSVSRGRLTLTSLSSHRGCRPLFSCQKIAKNNHKSLSISACSLQLFLLLSWDSSKRLFCSQTCLSIYMSLLSKWNFNREKTDKVSKYRGIFFLHYYPPISAFLSITIK